MIKGTGQRLIPRKLLEWIKGLHKGEGAGLNISTLTDSDGNSRFIEGDGVTDEIEGFTASYCKWSLSGTHLMIVLSGSVANGTTISSGSIATYEVPTFIMNKIYPVWASRFLEIKTLTLVADDFSTQTLSALFNINTGKLNIYIQNSATLSKDRAFRLQFDLLIDNE